MSLVDGGHVDGNTPTRLHVAAGAEGDTPLQWTVKQTQAQEATASHSLSHHSREFITH